MEQNKDYINGYEEGKQRAKEGTDKNRWSWKRLITYIFSNSFDDYIEGVNQGYLDEIRQQYHDVALNKVYIEPEYKERLRKALQSKLIKAKKDIVKDENKNITKKGSSMNGNSFENQIRLLNQLKGQLLKMNDILRTMTTTYNQQVEDIKSAGMFGEPYNKFKDEYLPNTITWIDKMVQDVENNDIRFINEIITKIEPLTN